MLHFCGKQIEGKTLLVGKVSQQRSLDGHLHKQRSRPPTAKAKRIVFVSNKLRHGRMINHPYKNIPWREQTTSSLRLDLLVSLNILVLSLGERDGEGLGLLLRRVLSTDQSAVSLDVDEDGQDT